MHKVEAIAQPISALSLVRHLGHVVSLGGGLLHASGLDIFASLGDRVCIATGDDHILHGEIVALRRYSQKVDLKGWQLAPRSN